MKCFSVLLSNSRIPHFITFYRHWLSADNKEDRIAWIEVLNRQLSDSKAWSTKGFKSKSMAVNPAAHESQQKHRGGAVPV